MHRAGDFHHHNHNPFGGKQHKDYHRTHGVSFKHGYFYKGKTHTHWSHSCWSPRYGCNIYWCPSTCCWYYWCQPYNCYFPVSYCPTGYYGY
jgi:hypothetical protein